MRSQELPSEYWPRYLILGYTITGTAIHNLPALVGDQTAEVLLKRRGRPATPIDQHKVHTSIRLDPDLLDAFKDTGAGWQSRMNDALREWANSHGMLRGRKHA